MGIAVIETDKLFSEFEKILDSRIKAHRLLPNAWMTKKEVAKYIGVSVGFIDKWRKMETNPLPCGFANNEPRFKAEDVDNWMRRNKLAKGGE